jgi:hypothetical protein
LEGGNAEEMLARAQALVNSGVNVIALLALSDSGRSSFHSGHAAALAGKGAPVFACTPDQFPDLMASVLNRVDITQWAGARDIALIRAADGAE